MGVLTKIGVVVFLAIACLCSSGIADYSFRVGQYQGGSLVWWEVPLDLVEFVSDGVAPTRYPAESIPPPNSLSRQNIQYWYIEAETEGEYYLIRFKASAVGLEKSRPRAGQYWFVYSKDGIVWSKESDRIVIVSGSFKRADSTRVLVEVRGYTYDDDDDLEFYWSAASGNVQGYKVYLSIDGGEYSPIGSTATCPTEEAPYLLPVVPQVGSLYQIRVEAFGSDGETGPASEISDPVWRVISKVAPGRPVPCLAPIKTDEEDN
jgi:hypothetical protein